MIEGILIGVFIVVGMILSFMIGYGVADLKHQKLDEE